jgi:hypothetical protein
MKSNSATAIYVPLCTKQQRRTHNQVKINNVQSDLPQSHRQAIPQKPHSHCEAPDKPHKTGDIENPVPQQKGAHKQKKPEIAPRPLLSIPIP